MTWASERRLDYIDWRLAVHGTVRRENIQQAFGLSQGQASGDLTAFRDLYPDAMWYDPAFKRYMPSAHPYCVRRGMDSTEVRTALALLAKAGHPMGWT